MVPPESSVTILAGSLKFNHTYQFVVHMVNLRNLIFEAYGFLLVTVDDIGGPEKIAVA
jgi:hypothetical protein